MDKKKVEELIEQIQKYCDQAYSPNWQPKSFEEFVKLGNICREAIKELSKSDWVSVEDGLPVVVLDWEDKIKLQQFVKDLERIYETYKSPCKELTCIGNTLYYLKTIEEEIN